MKEKIEKFHDRYYRKLLLVPLILLLLSFGHLFYFYFQTGEFFNKDISLTGGTSVTIYNNIDAEKLEASLGDSLENINTRKIYDLVTREEKALVIETQSEADKTKQILENYLGYELNSENSSFEFTGSFLSESFFKQLILAILIAFTFMGWVVFLIFGEKLNLKIILGFIVIFNALLSISVLSSFYSILFSLIILIFTIIIYILYSIPSAAVIISAFADIIMTLAFANFIGIEISSAGIVAFLMIIGYSVDTDILLTTRILKRKGEGSLNERLFGAFKTGITMTLTSLFALTIALFIVMSFSFILTQIFTILVIGLSFDILNTWITNASILKAFVLNKK